MKKVFAIAASTVIADVISLALGLEDTKFPKRNLEDYYYGDFCSFCNNGDWPPNEYWDVTFETAIGNVTCATYNFLSQSERLEDCDVVQEYGFKFCGCKELCTPCADGSALMYPNNNFGTSPGLTCSEHVVYVLDENKYWYTAEDCDKSQVEFSKYCGCPIPSGGPSCSLCADGSEVPAEFIDTPFLDSTCGRMQEYAKSFPEGDICHLHQFQAFEKCGCLTLPEPIEDGCSICPEGWDIVPDVVVPTFESKTCKVFAEGVSSMSSDSSFCENEVALAAYEAGCCSSEERCFDKDWKTFDVGTYVKPCSFLNTLSENTREDLCYGFGVSSVCPWTCKGACSCRDGKWFKFYLKNGKTKNCFWLSKLKKKSLKKMCKWNKSARKNCPDTCQGWCTFKDNSDWWPYYGYDDEDEYY